MAEDGCGRWEKGWKREAGRPGSTTHDRGVFTIDGAVELVLGVSPPSCMFLEFGGEYGHYTYSARTHIYALHHSGLTLCLSLIHPVNNFNPLLPMCTACSHDGDVVYLFFALLPLLCRHYTTVPIDQCRKRVHLLLPLLLSSTKRSPGIQAFKRSPISEYLVKQ